MNIVIGSGPAGVSAAAALVKRGRDTLVIDPGISLESRNAAAVQRLSSAKPRRWSEADVKLMTETMQVAGARIPRKSAYGSYFPFRTPGIRMDLHDANASLSHATGGLSNVWGGCFLPIPAEDLTRWPLSREDLEPHYHSIYTLIPHTSVPDALDDLFPWTPPPPSRTFPTSRQIAEFLEYLDRNQARLKSRGIHHGRSRLGLGSQSLGEEGECRECGMCLYGCPYKLIYCSTSTLTRLCEEQGVQHRPGLIAERVGETANGAFVQCLDADTGEPVRIEGSKVFLAAGVMGSARILLASLDIPQGVLTAKHSDRLTLQLFRRRRTRGIMEEPLNTLCQAYLEIIYDKLGSHMVHLQVYGYNDLYLKTLQQLAKPITRHFRFGILLERLLYIYGYLHSDVSSTLNIQWNSRSRSLTVTGKRSPRARRAAWDLYGKLVRSSRELGGLCTPPMVDRPGGGNHTGGTLPMAQNPGPLETDILGRPNQFRRVHVVDASVLTTIPATTIALTAMANAHRIASLS